MTQTSAKVLLDAALVEGFQRAYLLDRFDNPQQPADFHRKMWEAVCSAYPRICIAAPRAHSKSTSITHTYALAAILFRVRDFCVIVSDTEGQAAQFLHDIVVELQENDELIRDFKVKGFTKDTATEIEVEFQDGAKFCVIAKGSEQKVRGLKWRGKRPNLILCDDIENDEAVQSPERRLKFSNWVLNALLPCGSKDCLFRVVGTVLHDAAMLERLLKDPLWHSLRFRAHKSFDDFTELLWPEQYDEAWFRDKRQQYISMGNPDGYAKEYLNDPIPAGFAIFNPKDIKSVDASDYNPKKTFYCTTDFAVSTKQRADRSVFLVFSINSHGFITIEHIIKGRWDPEELITKWFELDEFFKEVAKTPIELYVVEEGTINKAIGPYLFLRMRQENRFFELYSLTPTTDKQKRARPIQGRVKAGGVKADKSADWYTDFEHELSRFPSGAHDDQVDAFSLVGLVLDKLIEPPTEEEDDEDEWEQMSIQNRQGRSETTGY